ncbi:MAG: ABC transporter permease, partial [Paramuribaculum sp.]|nr:ABC transporter permease [Paramuribaculum sp.]
PDHGAWSPTAGPDGQDTPGPVIMSKGYLTLYNFGFAASRGYPQISEATIGELPLRLYLSGRGREMRLQGRIVGFSSRLNTFAVPESFLEWANAELADEPSQQPSRLILEVNTPGDPAIQRYFDEHSYESAGDKADTGRAAYFLSLATGAVMSVGVVISVLAFFILLLSIHLLIQKNREKLRSLMMLGYSPGAVARQYYMIVGALNAVVLGGAVAAVLVARSFWSASLGEIGAESASPWITIAVGVVIILVVTGGNMRIIRREISKTFPRPRR